VAQVSILRPGIHVRYEVYDYDGLRNNTIGGVPRIPSYYRARYYNPTTGRFLSEDPIGFGGGINLYAYAANNPMSMKDPLGTCAAALEAHPCLRSALIGLLLALAIGLFAMMLVGGIWGILLSAEVMFTSIFEMAVMASEPWWVGALMGAGYVAGDGMALSILGATGVGATGAGYWICGRD